MNIFKRSKLSFLRLQNIIKNKIDDRINVLFGFHFTECFFVLEVVKIYKESCIFPFHVLETIAINSVTEIGFGTYPIMLLKVADLFLSSTAMEELTI